MESTESEKLSNEKQANSSRHSEESINSLKSQLARLIAEKYCNTQDESEINKLFNALEITLDDSE